MIFGRFRSCWPKGRLFRSAVLLSGSTLIIQVVGIGLAPIYSRLYAPYDYGVFGQFYSIVSSLLTVGCLCFELAVPTAKEEEQALALVTLSLGCLGLITLGSLGWVTLELYQSIHLTGAAHGFYFLLIPVGVLLAGFYRVAQYWAIRCQALEAVAGTSLKQMVGGQAVNMGFAVLHPNPLGLILGQIVSWSAGAGSLSHATNLLKLLKLHHRSLFRFRRLWQAACSYRDYALTQCPSTLFNSLGFYLPGMLMLPYFGAEFAGQFNLAQRLGRLPILLVGSSISQVFFSEAASIGRNDPGKLLSLFNSFSRKLALCSVLVMAGCLLAPIVVPVAFGHRWHEAGQLTMWLGFGLGFQLSVSPLSNIPNIVGRLKGQLVIDALRAAFVFGALFIPYKFSLGGQTAVLCYSVVMIINYIACFWLYRHQLMVHSHQLARPQSERLAA